MVRGKVLNWRGKVLNFVRFRFGGRTVVIAPPGMRLPPPPSDFLVTPGAVPDPFSVPDRKTEIVNGEDRRQNARRPLDVPFVLN